MVLKRDWLDKGVDILWIVFCVVMLILSLYKRDMTSATFWSVWVIFNYIVEHKYN